MDFVGAPQWFQFSETLPEVGVLAPGAAARIGDIIYAWTNLGFVAINQATGVTSIGAGRVDRFAFSDLDDAFLFRMTAVADPRSGRVFWAYPGAGNTDGLPNRIIVYDRNLDKWAIIHQDVELLWRAGGVGFTMDGLDAVSASLDDLEVSLDSSQWKGGATSLLAAFNSSHRHGFFDGSPMTATIDTKETEIHAGHRTHLNAFRPLVDGGSVTAQVGYRNRQSDPVVWGPVLSQSASGRFTTRVNARYHRVRLNASGNWTDLIGIQVDPRDARKAEGR
jgi:hypothetical protein